MGHLLKIKCVDSRVNVQLCMHILASTSVPNTCTQGGASAKFSTNSHETVNSAFEALIMQTEGKARISRSS
jgi:hypothetical protein